MDEPTRGYSVPFLIPEGDYSDRFKIIGRPRIADVPSDAIPLESLMWVYFIGTVVYSGTDDEMQALDFCFQQGPAWVMRYFGNSPYNGRRKLHQ
jgi:hypothetical protein